MIIPSPYAISAALLSFSLLPFTYLVKSPTGRAIGKSTDSKTMENQRYQAIMLAMKEK